MKKLSLIMLAVLFSATTVFAQKGKVTQATSFFTAGKLDEAKKTIDEAMAHETCLSYDKGYFTKGQIYQAIFESPLANYKKLSDNALDIAWEAYQKVIELDVKKKYTKKLQGQYQNLVLDYTNMGVELYNANNFAGAFASFEKSLDIRNTDIYTAGRTVAVDTVIIFNTGVAAHKAGDFENAAKYYKESLKYNYEPARTYAMLANVLKSAGHDEESMKYLHEGFEKFPSDEYMIVELINYYLLGDEPEKAEVYLDAAIKTSPNNASFYRAKGTLYEKLGNVDGAKKMYKKALELDPKDFIAQYNLGNMELTKAIEYHKKVQDIMNIDEYNKEIKIVYSMYATAVPYFEKALEINSEDNNTIVTLRELYYKLRNEDPEYQSKYDVIDAKYKALGN